VIKSIFITAYNREKIFFNTLKKLKKCKNYDQFKKLVVYQDVNKGVIKKIEKIDPNIDVVQTKYPKKFSSFQKLNHNSYLGFKKCFDEYKSSYVIFIEDDILPSYDFLEYHNHMNLIYHKNREFFGANSFSKENRKKLDFSYSKFIYGIAKGWSVPKERWNFLKEMYKELIKTRNDIYYDCFFEPHIKKKYFVVMPYRSRSYEQPSNGLNSKIVDKYGDHMINWKKSFLDKSRYKLKNYTFMKNMTYTWRKDCHSYTKFNILVNNLKYLTVKSYIFIKLKDLIKYIIGDNFFYWIKKYLFKVNLYR
tara:strand:- start:300 stop:1217 length:918 start_codon:yes stop_codon:yes gene_type:complete